MVEIEIVGHEALAARGEELFNDGMAAAGDEELAGFAGMLLGEDGTGVVTLRGEAGEGEEDVEPGNGGGGVTKARRFGGDFFADLGEEATLDFENARVSFENFALEHAKFGGGEAFGVDESLFAFVVGWREVEIGFGNFDVVAEDLIEADFERADAGAEALALLDGGDGLFATAGERAELVEFGVIAGADVAGLVGEGRRIVGNGGGDEGADVWQVVEFGSERGDFWEAF